MKYFDIEIYLDNVGNFENLNVTLENQFSVLTGYGDLGKTLILKAIFAGLKLNEEWINSINEKILKEQQKSYFNNIESMKNILKIEDTKYDLRTLQVEASRRIANNFAKSLYKNIFGTSKVYERLNINNKFELDYKEYIGKIKNDIDLNVIYVSSSKVLEYSKILLAGNQNLWSSKEWIAPITDIDLLEKISNEDIYSDEGSNYIQIDDENESFIKNGDGEFVKANELGDGIKIFSILNQLKVNRTINKDTILLLDEPDNGVHSTKLPELVELLKSLECKVVLTSHNSTFINLLNDTDMSTNYVFKKEESTGIVNIYKKGIYETVEHLDGYSIEDFM